MPDEQTMSAHIEELLQERSRLYSKIRMLEDLTEKMRGQLKAGDTQAQKLTSLCHVLAENLADHPGAAAAWALYEDHFARLHITPFRYKDASNNGD